MTMRRSTTTPPVRASLSRFRRSQAIRPRERPWTAFASVVATAASLAALGAASAVGSCNGAVIRQGPLSTGDSRPALAAWAADQSVVHRDERPLLRESSMPGRSAARLDGEWMRKRDAGKRVPLSGHAVTGGGRGPVGVFWAGTGRSAPIYARRSRPCRRVRLRNTDPADQCPTPAGG
jgi:hypothetical protein